MKKEQTWHGGWYCKHSFAPIRLESYYRALHLAICIRLMNEYVDLMNEYVDLWDE